jgi:hypothetical protein
LHLAPPTARGFKAPPYLIHDSCISILSWNCSGDRDLNVGTGNEDRYEGHCKDLVTAQKWREWQEKKKSRAEKDFNASNLGEGEQIIVYEKEYTLKSITKRWMGWLDQGLNATSIY